MIVQCYCVGRYQDSDPIFIDCFNQPTDTANDIRIFNNRQSAVNLSVYLSTEHNTTYTVLPVTIHITQKAVNESGG